MGLIDYYLIFALSVGIWACIDLIPEVRSRLFEENRLDDVMYASPKIVFTVMLVICSITAPIVVMTILVPTWRKRAIDNMVKAL